jgi:tetratricopeptide (TPR) repeat protein
VALTATAIGGSPVFAQAAPATQATNGDRAKARADAVTQSNSLRTMRKYQEALDTVMPYAGDKDYNILVAIGQAIEGWTTPADRLRAIEWYEKAIALDPANKTGYARRAGAFGDAGFRYFEERLADRQRVVDMAEGASPAKLASAGEYGDLAGANDSFVIPRGGGGFDTRRRDLVMDLRSKAIALDPSSYGRFLDRAEFINSRHRNPSMGRDDVDRARFLVRSMDRSLPATWYAQAQFARRVASLPTSMTLAGSSITVDGITTPYRASVAQLRNRAIDNYSRYIKAFEESGRDYSKLGDGVGAYENRAAVYRSLGGTYHRSAIDDQETLIAINPRNAGYWRNLATSLDAISERRAANAYYEKYLDLNGSEDLGDVGATRARLASG